MNGRHSPECVAARVKWRGRLARLIDRISRGRRSGNGAAAKLGPERPAERAAALVQNHRTLSALGYAM